MKKIMRVIPLLLFAPLTLGMVGCDNHNAVENNGIIILNGNYEQGNITINGVDNLEDLVLNAEVSLKIEPKNGYELVSVKVNGEDITDTLKFIITDVSKNYEIEVIFKEIDKKPDPDVDPKPDKPVDPDPDKPVEPEPNPDPEPDPEPDPNPEPDPEPEPDPTPDPEPVDPDKKHETIDGVNYVFEDNLVVEKIYDPKYIGNEVNYSGVNKQEFYDFGYLSATTYNDAIARSNAHLLSGNIEIPKNIANYNNISNPKSETGPVFYNARARYIYADSTYSEPIGYIINDTDGDDSNDTVIYKGGAYISMDEVSAYLFAFNEPPRNWIADKGDRGKTQAVDLWGQYGRVNNGDFSGNPSRYPYQPILTGNDRDYRYRETDFGTDGDFLFYAQHGKDPNVKQKPYVEGKKINRGTCRFCYTAMNHNSSAIEEEAMKHVFYTWSHYNDFEEYLNYKGGYGPKFGNLVVGNEYNAKNPEHPVSQPADYILATFNY